MACKVLGMPCRRRFEVLLYRPEWNCSVAVRTVRVRSLVRARAVARRLLAPHVYQTTRALYHYSARYLWTANVYKPGGRAEGYEAERVLVPSVGELGICP